MNKEELKKQQLRIGNIVWGVSDRIEIITELKKETVVTKTPLLDDDYEIEYKYISPIELTKEWLLKFDFEIRYFNNDPEKPLWWKVEKNRHIDIYPHPEHKFYFLINSMQMSTPIKYVHQLQNLYFSLTGEELNAAEKDENKKHI